MLTEDLKILRKLASVLASWSLIDVLSLLAEEGIKSIEDVIEQCALINENAVYRLVSMGLVELTITSNETKVGATDEGKRVYEALLKAKEAYENFGKVQQPPPMDTGC